MTERRVLAGRDDLAGSVLAEAAADVLDRNALAQEVLEQDQVGGLRVDVVGAQEVELLHALRQEVVDRRGGLLVDRFGGVGDVLGLFFTLVLDGVEEEAVVLLIDREDGLAGHRGPAAERHRDLVLFQQLLSLFGEERPVRGAVDDDRLDLLAEDAALGVDLVEGEEQDVAEGGLRDRHRSRQRVEHANLDGFFRPGGRNEGGQGESPDREQTGDALG